MALGRRRLHRPRARAMIRCFSPGSSPGRPTRLRSRPLGENEACPSVARRAKPDHDSTLKPGFELRPGKPLASTPLHLQRTHDIIALLAPCGRGVSADPAGGPDAVQEVLLTISACRAATRGCRRPALRRRQFSLSSKRGIAGRRRSYQQLCRVDPCRAARVMLSI